MSAISPAVDELVERVAARVAELLAETVAPAASTSPWMDASETAEWLRCKPKRIYELASQGRLPAHREGSRLLFHRGELDEYLLDDRESAGAGWHGSEKVLQMGSRPGAQRISNPQVQRGDRARSSR